MHNNPFEAQLEAEVCVNKAGGQWLSTFSGERRQLAELLATEPDGNTQSLHCSKPRDSQGHYYYFPVRRAPNII